MQNTILKSVSCKKQGKKRQEEPKKKRNDEGKEFEMLAECQQITSIYAVYIHIICNKIQSTVKFCIHEHVFSFF